MRRNLFLHFLNRDTREIFGIYRFHDAASHVRILRQALNAAVLLCEDYCTLPPGFLVEDEIAFGLGETQRWYLENRVLRFPMREQNLGEYAEKKRHEYSPMRNRYSGLFDDTRLDFLGRHARGIVPRISRIGENIAEGWMEGPDTNAAAWRPVKTAVPVKELEIVRTIPAMLLNRGTALTWSAIEPELPTAAKVAAAQLRNSLQHTYFKQYCEEYNLLALSSVPFIAMDFYLPRKPRSYDFERLSSFFGVLGLKRFFLDESADILTELRQDHWFISFMDAYVDLAEKCRTLTELQYFTDVAKRKVDFRWAEFGSRFIPFVQDPSLLELRELLGALGELAAAIRTEHGFSARSLEPEGVPAKKAAKGGVRMAKVVLFVALQEELDALTKALGFDRHASAPAASGRLQGFEIDVLCPRDMGRVPAAVEVSTYLANRQSQPPTLILVLGLAGGFEDSGTAVGHTLCATRIVDLANRKIQDEEDGTTTKFRRRDFTLNLKLRDLLESDEFDRNAWQTEAIDKADWPADRRPSIHPGSVASTDEVTASTEWSKKLLAHGGKLLGIEMEAGGVCASAEKHQIPVSMLRVVSDRADPSKADDIWRLRGMKTLALLLQHLPIAKLIHLVESR